jgi:hypothetical protein
MCIECMLSEGNVKDERLANAFMAVRINLNGIPSVRILRSREMERSFQEESTWRRYQVYIQWIVSLGRRLYDGFC